MSDMIDEDVSTDNKGVYDIDVSLVPLCIDKGYFSVLALASG